MLNQARVRSSRLQRWKPTAMPSGCQRTLPSRSTKTRAASTKLETSLTSLGARGRTGRSGRREACLLLDDLPVHLQLRRGGRGDEAVALGLADDGARGLAVT